LPAGSLTIELRSAPFMAQLSPATCWAKIN